MEIFGNYYGWLRALHIIAVIAWMAGLMYLPRLYVYHSKATIGSELDETLKTMEFRLYKYIMNPSSIIVWILGTCLIFGRGGHSLFSNIWFDIKLLMVILITIIHHIYGIWLKKFKNGERPLNHIVYRVINEVPFVLMMIAVFMVVLEPLF